MPITIAVSSFKGGTAKTSVSLHLAAALALFHGYKVLAIDFDAQANMSTGLGFDPDEHDSLAPVLQKERKIEDVILPTSIPSMSLIPADSWLERVEVTGPLASDRYSHERLKDLIKSLDYDFVIIDTPPSLCWLTESSLIAADHALICATPEFYSVKGLERLSLFLSSISLRHPLNILGVALSFWNARGKSNDAFTSVIEDTFPEKILQTKIRRDISVTEASIYGRSLFETAPKSRAAEDFTSLTEEIVQRLDGKERNNSHGKHQLAALATS
jgi:chromosome partitioning protein